MPAASPHPSAERLFQASGRGGTTRIEVAGWLHECLDDAPMKWQEIADLMGVDASLLSHWCSGERTPIPADRLAVLTAVIGPSFLRRLAKACGFGIYRLDEGRPNP